MNKSKQKEKAALSAICAAFRNSETDEGQPQHVVVGLSIYFCDKVDLFAPELGQVKIKITPTYLEYSSSRKFQIAKLYLRVHSSCQLY